MKHLRFKNMVFHKGLNYTVRLGDNWNESINENEIVSFGKRSYANIIEIIFEGEDRNTIKKAITGINCIGTLVKGTKMLA